ncbi:glucosaminidase domain-containing protein [Sediminibacterium soli]|uniref:glucosaminidase domain-containing protein n=1 Tax=Sediminibacterium soli TaxID=2698829 RepID=UPI00137B0B1B|nr:glucosaminidase domain-containing protein [Sediminibacterium soli]NCI45709.1 LysM peptidoglycan-binding domain-containing protein [Sediminibacterium soli]
MKKIFFFLCLPLGLAVHAQKQKTEAYIDNYKETAIVEMMRSGVPAAITLAQGILESKSGESELVKNSNNHFGIKCKTEWTGEKTYHDDDEKGECFRVYPSAADSYKDHSDFLKTRPHYAFLFKLDPTDFEGWAKGLKKAGYATSPAYPQKLLKLINEYRLQQYSLEAMARLKNGIQPDNSTVIAAAATGPAPIPAAAVIEKPTGRGEQPEETKEPEAKAGAAVAETVAAPLLKKASYPQGVFTINHTKVVYATAGTSLLSLANDYDLPLVKLVEYNDLKEMDILDADRLMFIEKKQKKGASDFHTVAEGETLHDVCQLEGIRMENLLDYNDNLSKDSRVLKKGDKIYLRTVAAAANTKPLRNSARKS